jgi:molecular chaperone DnaK
MVADARDHEAEDKKRREEVEQKNRAENLAYQMEKLVKDNKEKLSAATVSEIEDAVKKVHEVREKGSADEIKAAVEHLEKASHKAAEELYKTAGAAAAGAEGAPQPPPDSGPGKKEDVVDAEYKQV